MSKCPLKFVEYYAKEWSGKEGEPFLGQVDGKRAVYAGFCESRRCKVTAQVSVPIESERIVGEPIVEVKNENSCKNQRLRRKLVKEGILPQSEG
ncbi:MAG: hypothetical protein UT39_C0002G0108 [Candidatus Woesebacteria bacterium GW2011_GWA1_39_21]|uniref:Uncharacterized protein n=1 Tax=Candidatus Woesebacteria bacterium GW2011_GWA1_39_21 TaxID=1618550 RepID=A0A0G0RE28_9BACT|nr:MAG: hypothetical protein UT39_C0002G0108 [Candidatus Woesebacteria bacterium GW2011_GWA1_39_21]